MFRTDARALEFEILTSTGQLDADPHPRPTGMLELLVNGALAGRRQAPVGNVLRMAGPGAVQRLVPGKPGTVRFAGLPTGMKNVELWLPQQTPTELVALRADGDVLAPLPDGRRRWVHHGSSISHCIEADGPTGTWPVVAAALGGVEVINLSQAGNALLDPYVARTIRDTPADLISLKVGINIVSLSAFRLRTFGPAVHGFLDTIRDGRPDTPLLLISPVSCPALEQVPGPTKTGPDGRIAALGDPADVKPAAHCRWRWSVPSWPGSLRHDRHLIPTSTISTDERCSARTRRTTCPTAFTPPPPRTAEWASASLPTPSRPTVPSAELFMTSGVEMRFERGHAAWASAGRQVPRGGRRPGGVRQLRRCASFCRHSGAQGKPGYGLHLDRSGDRIRCEWGGPHWAGRRGSYAPP